MDQCEDADGLGPQVGQWAGVIQHKPHTLDKHSLNTLSKAPQVQMSAGKAQLVHVGSRNYTAGELVRA